MTGALHQFVQYAQDHGRFTLAGESSKTNAAYRKLRKVSEELRRQSDGGEAVLLALLEHNDASVQTWAAYYLLPMREPEAKRTLGSVASGAGLVAFDAGITLKEWEAGRLQIL